MVAKRLDQPPVIGEVLAGILLGPTFFGGAVHNALFPSDVRSLLVPLANVGVAMFMFVIGLEMDRNLLRGNGNRGFGLGRLDRLAVRVLRDPRPVSHYPSPEPQQRGLRAVHGRGHVGDGVPRAGADSDRPGNGPHRAGRFGAHLRGSPRNRSGSSVDLVSGVLLGGGDPPVTDQHSSTIANTAVCRH
jgi:hypothetical protein